jgi:hypothetical protein
MALNIPTGIPLRYELDDAYAPIERGGRYLDPAAALAGARAVADRGCRRPDRAGAGGRDRAGAGGGRDRRRPLTDVDSSKISALR